MSLQPSYENMKRILESAVGDLEILCGNEVGPSDVSWQDVAGTAAVNLHVLASLIEQTRVEPYGIHEPTLGPVFPSVREAIDALDRN